MTMVQSMPKIAPSRKELQEIHRKLSGLSGFPNDI